MLPWSVRGVTDLPADAKPCKMQQNADRLVQLIGAATLDVPNQTPMPEPSKLTPTRGATQQSVD